MQPSPTRTRLRAVLFDRDDTLAVTATERYREAAVWLEGRFGTPREAAERALIGQWQAQATAWQGLRTPEDEAVFWARYGEALAARLGLDAAHAPALLEAFPYERFLRPVEGAREVLSELRARGLAVGVLSNTLPSIGRTLEALGIDDLVDVAVATCTAGAHKPEPAAFLYALKQLGLPAGAVLFVDDRPENVAAARTLGMHAALIDLRGRAGDALHGLGAVLELVDELEAA